jgi:hypothetical protein
MRQLEIQLLFYFAARGSRSSSHLENFRPCGIRFRAESAGLITAPAAELIRGSPCAFVDDEFFSGDLINDLNRINSADAHRSASASRIVREKSRVYLAD